MGAGEVVEVEGLGGLRVYLVVMRVCGCVSGDAHEGEGTEGREGEEERKEGRYSCGTRLQEERGLAQPFLGCDEVGHCRGRWESYATSAQVVIKRMGCLAVQKLGKWMLRGGLIDGWKLDPTKATRSRGAVVAG